MIFQNLLMASVFALPQLDPVGASDAINRMDSKLVNVANQSHHHLIRDASGNLVNVTHPFAHHGVLRDASGNLVNATHHFHHHLIRDASGNLVNATHHFHHHHLIRDASGNLVNATHHFHHHGDPSMNSENASENMVNGTQSSYNHLQNGGEDNTLDHFTALVHSFMRRIKQFFFGLKTHKWVSDEKEKPYTYSE
jgi:YD repeat-containing protein